MSSKFSVLKSAKFFSLLLVGATAMLGTQLLPTKALLVEPVAQLPTASDKANSNFIAAAVDKTGPAVVKINSEGSLTNRFAQRGRMQGTGSGFIIKSDGLVLTNAHVVDGADTVTVTLKDGRNFIGQVLGLDRQIDLAVIKIPASDLPTAQIGNSERVRPGEWAMGDKPPLALALLVILWV